MILQPIDRNEALRYLGCKDGTDNEQMIAMLDSCEKQLLKAANPKYLYAVYPISFTDDGVRISDSNIILKGNCVAIESYRQFSRRSFKELRQDSAYVRHARTRSRRAFKASAGIRYGKRSYR